MIAEAVKQQSPPLSPEKQRKKNQAAIDLLNQRDEEDKTDDPQESTASGGVGRVQERHEQEPYLPPDHLSMSAVVILDSGPAMRCAGNSAG